jgi:hypothetical protein
MIDDSQYLIALAIIIPLNFFWYMIPLPWSYKRSAEIYFVLFALLIDASHVRTSYDLAYVLSAVGFFFLWYCQIRWQRPKYAYEL